jgi:hypothetical protein
MPGLKVGVWTKGGKVYRRDSVKEPYPRVCSPIRQEDLPRVIEIQERMFDLNTMSNWTPQVERESNDLSRELETLIVGVQ